MNEETTRLIWPLSDPPTWRASWIAPPDIAEQPNVVFRVHRIFTLEAVPERALLYISAEAVYRLQVNDQYIGRGPVRGSRGAAFYDSYDITTLLLAGENTITVTVLCPNVPTVKYASPQPAVLVQVENQRGELIVASGADWRAAVAADFKADVPLFTFQMGYVECRDLRATPSLGDMPRWPYAAVIAPAEGFADKRLLSRDIPALQERRLPALACPVAAEVPAHSATDGLTIAQRLACEHYTPLHDVHANLPCTLAPPADGGGLALIFDFGTSVTAGVELDIDAPAGTVLDVGYGEHLTDGRLRTAPEGKHSYHFADRFILPGGRATLGPTLAERGTRYAQLVFRHFNQPITLHQVRGLDRRYPLTPHPTPPSLPDDLKRIYDACVETIHACATDTLIDCPFRESAFWVNDFLVEASTWLAAGGDPRLIARCLRLTYSQAEDNGLVPAVCPTLGRPQLIFPATNAYLPLILAEYVQHTGDDALLHELLPAVARQQRALSALGREADGLLTPPPTMWNFVDWSFGLNDISLDGRCSASVNWFYVLGLDAWASLLNHVGDHEAAAVTRQRAKLLAAAAHRVFFDPHYGGYREWEAADAPCAQLAAALALRSGHLSDHQISQVAAALADDRQLVPELFMLRYLLDAHVQLGRSEQAIALIRKYWSLIVEQGSPTIWEAGLYQRGPAAFHGSASLCHGFSTAPLLTLKKLQTWKSPKINSVAT